MAVSDSSLIPDFSQLQLELVGISEGHRGLSRLFGLHFPSIFDDMRFVLDIRYLQSCQLYLTSIATASCRNAASERKEGCVFAWSVSFTPAGGNSHGNQRSSQHTLEHHEVNETAFAVNIYFSLLSG